MGSNMDWYSFKQKLLICNEIETHPNSKGTQSHLFSSISFESTELEYLYFLHSLVVSCKPKLVLETGTNIGISSFAIAFALKDNHSNGIEGHLFTVDKDYMLAGKAIEHANQINLTNYITFIRGDSLDFIQKGDHIGKYDIVYFDSARKIRPAEFYALQERNLIKKGCFLVFHDTCKCPIKDQLGDIDVQISYLTALDDIKKICEGAIKFELSRGLSVFQY